ncbi:hypothetical protein PCL_01622 [Purpureocillium lilacinum]|uniref:Uncharacterized protein n=1 Tax=Purpureocillium lilacinum TaxID=33203 RepID=A0A2U3E205_PURLI|nr:hypothetical protein PCL_01622 [Purpureocillium lilacinum]
MAWTGSPSPSACSVAVAVAAAVAVAVARQQAAVGHLTAPEGACLGTYLEGGHGEAPIASQAASSGRAAQLQAREWAWLRLSFVRASFLENRIRRAALHFLCAADKRAHNKLESASPAQISRISIADPERAPDGPGTGSKVAPPAPTTSSTSKPPATARSAQHPPPARTRPGTR